MHTTKKRMIEGLEAIGVRTGDCLAVGASYRSLGGPGPEACIDALLDAVGPGGTVMMNTHTRFFLPAEVRLGWTEYVFDAGRTPCITGIVAETFRRRPGAVRSRHPAFSVAAIGRHARFLTEGHDETAASYLPFERLASLDGKYLAVGIGDKLAGFRHSAQQVAGLLDVVPRPRAVLYIDRFGNRRTFLFSDRGGCTRRLPELVSVLRRQGLVTEGCVGRAPSILVPARQSLASMVAVLREHPEINVCSDPLCYWCRELERRLHLYGRIDSPALFQRNRAVRHVLSAANRVRELDNGIVAGARLLLRRGLRMRPARQGRRRY